MNKNKKILAWLIVIILIIAALTPIVVSVANFMNSSNNASGKTALDISLEIIIDSENPIIKNYKTERSNLKEFFEQTGLVTMDTNQNSKLYISAVDDKTIDIEKEVFNVYKNNTFVKEIENIPIYNNDKIKIELKELSK